MAMCWSEELKESLDICCQVGITRKISWSNLLIPVNCQVGLLPILYKLVNLFDLSEKVLVDEILKGSY